MSATSVVCPVLPPLVAYGEDFPRERPDEEDRALQGWLLVALCFWRVSQVSDEDQSRALAHAARMLSTLPEAGRREVSPIGEGAVDLAPRSPVGVRELLARAAEEPGLSGEWSWELTRAIRAGAEYLERRGAFRLAYSLLTSFRAAITSLSLREVGQIVVQQGRIARELGATQTAEDHYRAANRIGQRIREPDLRVRAILGRGVIAATRGNYPEARTLFLKGLRLARSFSLNEHETAAHNALLMAAVSAKDVEAALAHGWFLYRQASGAPERQAEVLVNLAEIALLAGHPQAALAACLAAVNLATVDRVLLAAYGSAAIAASRLARREVLDGIAMEAHAVIQQSSQVFDKAYTLLEFAEAYAMLHDLGDSRRYLAQARTIATPARFFEILHRADLLDELLAKSPSTSTDGEGSQVRVLSAGKLRPNPPRLVNDSTLSPASRRVIEALAELRS